MPKDTFMNDTFQLAAVLLLFGMILWVLEKPAQKQPAPLEIYESRALIWSDSKGLGGSAYCVWGCAPNTAKCVIKGDKKTVRVTCSTLECKEEQ